ncbi:unnamed protein product [Parnassius mnemosyne]|uniref:Uncharacterized protein n=1 Tax=Parnassius mnemosyne TaxID=213953 RepID=A0AAV1LKR7_9NEOP
MDVLYKKQDLSLSEDNDIDEIFDVSGEETEINSDDEDDVFYSFFPTREVDLDTEYVNIIEKVRKLVRLFKKSPTKNDLLQVYINQEFGKNLQLQLDCKTRWSSLADMISTFNKVLDRVFQPIKLAVEVLCRRDSDLVTAETTLRFMIRKLEELTTTLARKLAESLRNRIAER